MKEIFTMWKYPKMIALAVVSALLYALVLIPFKGFQLIPGIAELRPAAVLPPVLGILFGPAGAWGCAIGNTVGDYFGKTLTQGSAFGALGNFCFAMTAYVTWTKTIPNTSNENFSLASSQDLGRYISTCVLACASVAFIIAWGLEYLRLSTFAAIGSVILINNLAAALVLGPFLFKLFYSRAKAWNLLWFEILPAQDKSPGVSPVWTKRLMWLGAVGGLVMGLIVSHFFLHNPFLEAEAGMTDTSVVMVTAPFLLIFFLGCLLA